MILIIYDWRNVWCKKKKNHCHCHCHPCTGLVTIAPVTTRRHTGQWMRSGIGTARTTQSAGYAATSSRRAGGTWTLRRPGWVIPRKGWALLQIGILCCSVQKKNSHCDELAFVSLAFLLCRKQYFVYRGWALLQIGILCCSVQNKKLILWWTCFLFRLLFSFVTYNTLCIEGELSCKLASYAALCSWLVSVGGSGDCQESWHFAHD